MSSFPPCPAPDSPRSDRHPLRRYENPPGVTTEQLVRDFLGSERADRYNSPRTHDGGHFIPWKIPDGWVAGLRRTFGRRR
jgi:microsomal epoxide hydrolase